MKDLQKLLLVGILLIIAAGRIYGDVTITSNASFEVNGIYYEKGYYSNNKDESISGVIVTYRGNYGDPPSDTYSGNIVIPDKITYEGKTYDVIAISNNAFANCTKLTSIILPKSIKSILGNAFFNCKNLTIVSMPKGIEVYDAFDGCFSLFEKADSAIVHLPQTVVDTLKAETLFNTEIKPVLLANYQNGVEKLHKCEELLMTEQKKVKTPTEQDLLQQAYMKYLAKRYQDRYEDVRIKIKVSQYIKNYYYIDIVDEDNSLLYRDIIGFNKDVEKGKLTPNVREYLQNYYSLLTDSLKEEHVNIEKGWSEWISKDNLPYKEIVTPVKNSFCRGSSYYLQFIDFYEEYQQRKGWEFLYVGGNYQEDSYPVKVSYYVYNSHPNYRVIRDKKEVQGVFDNQGNLVYVPSLNRSMSEEFEGIKKLVYFKDYVNNKYDIKSQSEQTQEYVIYELSKDYKPNDNENDAFTTFLAAALVSDIATELLSPIDAYNAKNKIKESVLNTLVDKNAPRWDETGENYIKQLKKDHANDFGYVYMIKRLSDVSFQVVYINKLTLKPTYCGIVTYKTGETPYTRTFSTKLTEIPKDLPPIIG